MDGIATVLEPLADIPFIEDVFSIKRQWFVLVTEPQAERRVKERTEHLGNEVYVPVARTFPTPRPGRLSASPIVERPLFRNYAFVHLPIMNTPWSAYVDDEMTACPVGGRGFIKNNGRPEPLSLDIIEDLKAREVAGEFDETALTENERYVIPNWIKEGVRFTVVGKNPFFAHGGSIIEAINSKLVACWIHVFGTTTRTTMAIVDIRKYR